MFVTTEEQEAFRQAVRQMCEDRLAPRAAETDEKAQYPWYAHEAFTSMGLMGLTFPESYEHAPARAQLDAIAAALRAGATPTAVTRHLYRADA